jgi:hypothetical protein
MAELKLALSIVEGPVWLKPGSPGTEFFPAKSTNAPVITFLGSTAEKLQSSEQIEMQVADTPGRLSRAIPLFLAEQVWMKTVARVQTLVPLLMNDQAGFVLYGSAISNDLGSQYSSRCEEKSKFLVLTHIKCSVTPWIVEMRVIRPDSPQVVAEFSSSIDAAKLHKTLPGFAQKLISTLATAANFSDQKLPNLYEVPEDAQFGSYLLRLEQLFAVRSASLSGIQSSFLNGEREIIEGNIQLCANCPRNVVTRTLLAKTLTAMKAVRPGLLQDFKDKVMLLNRKNPLPQPAQEILEQVFRDAFPV